MAARDMADAVGAGDFRAMGDALKREWAARRRLAPVVSSPGIEAAIATALGAGAWGGKACGAGGGGCVVVLAPADRTAAVREALGRLTEGRLLLVAAGKRGPGGRGSVTYVARFIQVMQASSSRRICAGDSARCQVPCPGRTHSKE